jgi:hypothetical protein
MTAPDTAGTPGISAGHTSGPWEAVRFGKVLVVQTDAGLPLLRMYAGRNEEANARLIAAAPRMLEAGRNALHLLKALGMTHSREAVDLDAAIAEATGSGA